MYLIKYSLLLYKASGGKPVTLQRSGSLNYPKVEISEDSNEISKTRILKQSPATGIHAKSNEQALRKSFIVPNIVPRDIPAGKDSAKTGTETITFSMTKPGMLLRPAHTRSASTGIFDVERISTDVDSGTFGNKISKLDSAMDPNSQKGLGSESEVKDSCEDKHPIKSVTNKFEETSSPEKLHTLSTAGPMQLLLVILGRKRKKYKIVYSFLFLSFQIISPFI